METSATVIPLWLVVYNNSVDQVYTFTDHDKALASIESSMRTYLAESEVEDDVYKHVIASIRERVEEPYIPMVFDKLEVVLYRLEIDQTCRIHQLLARSRNQVNEQTREEIDTLFSRAA